ncbi:MAG: hypothetical protein H7Y59_06260 [Anaerolineales bacterium]|nr:hypothetical protein [Anaerolineales bacterium]
MNKTLIHQSEHIYDFLLKFYPENYRVEFEEEMKYVFSESLKDAYSEHGGQGIISLWLRTMIDACQSLIIQHIENQKGSNFMKTKNIDFLMQNKAILWVALGTGLLLMIPFIGMQVSDEWNWGFFDFIFIGGLIFGTGLTFVLIARQMNNLFYRIAVGLAGLAGFLLLWINAAVEVIGDDNPANLMYLGVLATAFFGAIIARFKAAGMTRSMFATAFAHTLVAVIALIFYPTASPGPFGILLLNGFFIMLWVGSALLFRNASADNSKMNV